MNQVKIFLFSVFILGSIGVIGVMFWEQELKFTKPTPKPIDFVELRKIGDIAAVGKFISVDESKPTMLHFFNSDCPCSKFNMREVAYLVETYGEKVNFVAVLQDKDPRASDEFVKKYNLKMNVLLDSVGFVSDYYGIYSTPQAVLLDTSNKIYYKGNYNKARFCSTRKTAFADIALKGLLAGDPLPKFIQQASIPYGCSLPSDTTQSIGFISSINFFN